MDNQKSMELEIKKESAEECKGAQEWQTPELFLLRAGATPGGSDLGIYLS